MSSRFYTASVGNRLRMNGGFARTSTLKLTFAYGQTTLIVSGRLDQP